MAVTTTNHTVSGKAVTVTADGDITAVQSGGPAGAWGFVDSLGNPAEVALGTDTTGSVFAGGEKAKTFVDAVVAARNA